MTGSEPSKKDQKADKQQADRQNKSVPPPPQGPNRGK
jgi:hypothetical protein